MVEDFEVAQLVHDDVVLQVCREKYNTVVEVEIFFGRTAPPSRGHVFDRNAVVRKAMHVELAEPTVHKRTRRFFVGEVVSLSSF